MIKLTETELESLDKISKKGITVIINAHLPNSKDLDLISGIYLRNTVYDQDVLLNNINAQKENT